MSDDGAMRAFERANRRLGMTEAKEVPPIVGARAFNNANISINNTTNTALTFNSERYDNGGLHSTSSATGRMTVTIPGRYAFWATVRFAANATGFREVAIVVNGTINIAIQDTNAIAGGVPTIVTCAGEFDMAAGDYAEVFVFQNSGGALNVETANAYSPEFAANILL